MFILAIFLFILWGLPLLAIAGVGIGCVFSDRLSDYVSRTLFGG